MQRFSPVKVTSGKKSAKEVQTLLLEEIKQLESSLEKQILKTNVLEKELEGLKKENSFLKTGFQSQMNSIELIINKNYNNDIDCNDFSTSQDTDNELNTNTNSTLDFSIVTENPPAAAKPPLSVPLNQECETPKRDYKNAVKNSIAVLRSPQVNTDVNNCVGSNVNAKNNSYPLQPSVKPKTNRNGKFNLLVVGDSHIKCIEKDLIIHHLNNKNVSLKYKNFDGADVRRVKHHLLPALHEDQIESVIIHGGTNYITESKLHTTRPHDLAIKIIDIGNTCMSFGIKSIAISSILPRKDQECQKRIDETNSYLLKDLCGFYGFSFIDNSNINEIFLHRDEFYILIK